MFFQAASLGLSVIGALSARKRRKEEQERLRIEGGKQRRSAQLAEDDLFIEASAAQSQQTLMVEREALAEQASDESLRQSRLLDQEAEFEVGGQTGQERSKKRKSFFSDTGGAL